MLTFIGLATPVGTALVGQSSNLTIYGATEGDFIAFVNNTQSCNGSHANRLEVLSNSLIMVPSSGPGSFTQTGNYYICYSNYAAASDLDYSIMMTPTLTVTGKQALGKETFV
jgi:hypothetical protein